MAHDTVSSPALDTLVCATSDLELKFSISKSTRAKRLNQLGLFPETLHKDGKKYWLTQAQLNLFAEFDRYIVETGSEDGCPLIYSNKSEPPADEPPANSSTIFTEIEQELAGELAITEQIVPDLATTSLTNELTPTSFTPDPVHDLLIQQINQNAQQRAAAIMLAEHTLANQYLQNPQALDPQLLAQINAVRIPGIDPNAFAAKLISGAQRIGLNI